MTDQLENDLRLLLADDADRAPASDTLMPRVQGLIRQRRQRVRAGWVGASVAAASAAGLTVAAVTGVLNGGPVDRVASSAQAAGSQGGLLGVGSASCAKAYSPGEVEQRAFAFSGTVRSIGASRTNRAGAELPLVSATFDVDHWFKGGAGQTVIVDIDAPEEAVRSSEASPRYGIGTRLLVSGEHRWDKSDPNDLLAWSCGFTRYYDTATANSWNALMR